VIVQYAVLSDVHFPYEGPAYYAAIEEMRTWPNLKEIFLNGDILEIVSCSRHPKTPGAINSLLAECDYANQKFDTLQKLFPNIPIRFIEGNHENRIFKYLRDEAPTFWGLIHAPKLFNFEDRGWLFFPYEPMQWVKCGKTKDLYLRHEPLVMGANHAKGTAEKSYVSIMYGHVHQRAEYTHKKLGPTPYHVTAYSPGWLGDINKECFNYRGAKDNWSNGFARIDCDEKSGEYEVKLIKF
jgi:hypothetical protein